MTRARTRAERETRTGGRIARTRSEALAQVAGHMAGLLMSGTIEEATGLVHADRYLTDAEAERYAWAMDEVARRLYKMGEKGTGA
jgi:hypothetical protein